ncbi:MAG: SCO family protein [Ignavibacteria bacterium]|nr:SCO family protein [Ignavibacteria bacterium]
MKKIIFSLIFISVIIPLTTFNIHAEENEIPKEDIGIYEKLGDFIPGDVMLNDEKGNQINLKDLVKRPTVFSFVYFRCPGVCTPLLNGLTKVIDKADIEPGIDYDIFTISFDYTEDHVLASGKKETYLSTLDRNISPEAWRFLSGDSLNIRKITDAVGFKFARQGNDFIHGASLIMISPEGKVIRYLYGTDYLPFDLKMAVTEASEGRSVPTITKMVKMCFSYDPAGRKYVLNVTRIAGAGMIILLGIFVGYLTLKKKKTNLNNT